MVELRRRAEEYKTRAEGVHFPPYHLSRHQHHDTTSSETTSTVSSAEEHTESELSSPSSSSSGSSVPADEDHNMNSNQEQLHSIRNPQLRGKEKTQLFAKPPAPFTSGHGVGVDSGHHKMMVEDVEENWDSETLTDDRSSQGGGHSSSTPQANLPPPTSQETSHAELRSKSIPRPNVFNRGDGEIEGRVPTPELRKSSPNQQSRHHLDITTPSGGGLLISPAKPMVVGGDKSVANSVALPYPPTSPKYRRDMKSKVPIFPSPQREVHNDGVKMAASPTVHGGDEEAGQPQTASVDLGPRSVPSSNSPYHAHCVPHPPPIPHSSHTHNLAQTRSSHPHTSHHTSQPHTTTSAAQPVTTKPSLSGPVRKLLFDSHTKHPSQHRTRPLKHTTQPSSSSQHRLRGKQTSLTTAKSSHSNMQSCETCGAHLRSSSILGGGVGVSSLGVGHSSRMRTAPPTNLSKLHEHHKKASGSGTSALQASRQQSQLKLHEIRSKLASHSTDSRHHSSGHLYHTAPPSSDRQHLPDSGLGSSNREQRGGLRSDILGHSNRGGMGQRAQDVDELSLSSLSLSSCSVASDMLRKAQERRDRFWTQSSRITAS